MFVPTTGTSVVDRLKIIGGCVVLIADRMKKIDSSGIRKVFNLAASMTDPVNLSIGQPDFDVPEVIKEAAIKAIRDGKNAYTLTQGIPELRKYVEDLYRTRYGFRAEGSIITSGVSGGLLLALFATVNDGDEVLIPDPYFVMYKHLVNLLGGVPVFYSTYPDFKVHRKEIESKITKKTKLLLLNSPANPTGAVLSEADLRAAADIAKTHGLLIITDEIYDTYVYDGKFRSVTEFTDNVLVLNGFSKTVSITGWRVGYALGKSELIDEMIKLQQYSFVCAPSFAQYALMELEKVDQNKIRNTYQEKRDIVYQGLKDRFEVNKPEGAFYIFPKVPGKYRDASEFVEKAISQNVLIIPGNVFSEKNTHFRLAFAADNKVLERGVKILTGLV
jgi:aspartate/methionine/tyrosine aminotransferase